MAAEKADKQQPAAILEIEAKRLIHAYKHLGVDISRLVDSNTVFVLHEDAATGLRQFTPAITGDDKFYQELSALPWYYREEKPEFNEAISMLLGVSSPARVLEIGCGTGHFSSLLRKNLSTDFEYTGLEMNPVAAASARQRGACIAQEDMMLHAQTHPNHYDVVCSFQVLEHFRDPAEYFLSMHTLLRPGGLSILSVPAEDSFMAIDQANILNAPPHHITRWTDKALDLFPRQYGFRLSFLKHLPVEEIHAKAFFHTLVNSQLSQKAGASRWFWKQRLVRRIAARFLSDFLGKSPINPMFFIPGHTVIALYRKEAC